MKTISAEKVLLIEEIKEAITNVKLVKEGKLKAKSVRELLNDTEIPVQQQKGN